MEIIISFGSPYQCTFLLSCTPISHSGLVPFLTWCSLLKTNKLCGQTITSRPEVPSFRSTKGLYEAPSPPQMVCKILSLHMLISMRAEDPATPPTRFSDDSLPQKQVL